MILKAEDDEIINQKMRTLAEDKRLQALRKIMHKDLHIH